MFEILEDPKRFCNYTPAGLEQILEGGYKVNSLGDGDFKGFPFEKGGGCRINYGGEKAVMFHPANRSHYGGAYYKISYGTGGIERYDLDGKRTQE